MAENNENVNNQYFAAKTPEETANIVLGKADKHFKFLDTTAYLSKLIQSWRMYHGAYYTGVSTSHQVFFGGEQGEQVNLAVNHFRNIARHMLEMITANRPVLEARAINTDLKSLAQTKLANGLLDYYVREKRLEMHLKRATELSIVMGAGFIKMGWNATSGEQVDFDEELGVPIYEGDVEFSTLSPLDVYFDNTKEMFTKDWIVTRSFRNKYDLAAKYPELADKLTGLRTKGNYEKYNTFLSYDETDDVAVFEFFHARTEAMPQGRYMLFCTNDTILQDGPLPYTDIPVYRVSPSDILGTPFGYTPLFDLMPIQETINSLYSTISTNQNAFGVQNILLPRGADIVPSQLGGGLNVIEYNQNVGKPEALNLTATPKEVFDFLQMLEKQMEILSGVSSVTRGAPEASLRTGAALALVQSMSIQFLNGLQQSYVMLLEEVGSGLLTMLKQFASTKRVAAIVGKNNQTELLEFKGEDLSNIQRVSVTVGNALARTTAGRFELANQFIQYGIVKDPREIFQLMDTGQIQSIMEDDQKQLILVRAENEALQSGQTPVVATILDEHMAHINKHKEVIADPRLRMDPELVQRVLSHIQEHINLLQTGDPTLLQLTGNPNIQQPPMQPGQEGGPQGGPPVMQPPGQVRQPSPAKVPNPPAPFQGNPTNPAERPQG